MKAFNPASFDASFDNMHTFDTNIQEKKTLGNIKKKLHPFSYNWCIV